MALIKFERKTCKTLHALDSFGRYWGRSEELISQDADMEELLNPPNWNAETESQNAEYQAEVAEVRRFPDYDMKRSLRYTCTALLYSLVEFELNRFVLNLDGKAIKQKNGENFLEAFCRHLKSHSLDFSGFAQYSSMLELQAVRHCIIHCWGQMEHVKPGPKTKLFNMSDLRQRGILCPESGEIRIEKQFLERMLSDSWDLFHRLFAWAQWRIDERWLKRSE
jgi:hypothetical protein